MKIEHLKRLTKQRHEYVTKSKNSMSTSPIPKKEKSQKKTSEIMVKEDGGLDTTSSRPREETTKVVVKDLD